MLFEILSFMDPTELKMDGLFLLHINIVFLLSETVKGENIVKNK